MSVAGLSGAADREFISFVVHFYTHVVGGLILDNADTPSMYVSTKYLTRETNNNESYVSTRLVAY